MKKFGIYKVLKKILVISFFLVPQGKIYANPPHFICHSDTKFGRLNLQLNYDLNGRPGGSPITLGNPIITVQFDYNTPQIEEVGKPHISYDGHGYWLLTGKNFALSFMNSYGCPDDIHLVGNNIPVKDLQINSPRKRFINLHDINCIPISMSPKFCRNKKTR